MTTYAVPQPVIDYFFNGVVAHVDSIFTSTTSFQPVYSNWIITTVPSVFSSPVVASIGGSMFSQTLMFSSFPSYISSSSDEIVYFQNLVHAQLLTGFLPPPCRWGAGSTEGHGF